MSADSKEPPYDPSLPPESWFHLGWYFDGLLIHNLVPKDKRPSVFSFFDSDGHSADQLIALMEKAEEPHLPEVESAICLMSISGEVDLAGFSPEALSVIDKRAETIASYIHTFTVKDASPFPVPTCPMSECIRWLMIDWWNEHGRQMSVDIHLSEAKGR